MCEIKNILNNYKSIAMVGVSKDLKKNINYWDELYARLWF